MPRLLDTETRTTTVVTAINHLLARDGAGGVTMRAIGELSRVSPATLSSHYGNREHMLRVAAWVTGQARLTAIRDRMRRDGVLAFLPADADDVVTARVWLGWCELGRSHDWLGPSIAEIRDEERALLARTVDYRLERERLTEALAVVDGLQVALCAPDRPLARETAYRILARHVERVGVVGTVAAAAFLSSR